MGSDEENHKKKRDIASAQAVLKLPKKKKVKEIFLLILFRAGSSTQASQPG